MNKIFPSLLALLFVFLGSECVSWPAPLRHDVMYAEDPEIAAQPVEWVPPGRARGTHLVSLRLRCAPLRATPQRLPFSRDPIPSEGSRLEAVARVEGSKDFKEDFEKQMKSLLKDLEKLEKEAKEKMTKEILPYLREEIEKIKKWLKDFRLEKEKEDQPERIRI